MSAVTACAHCAAPAEESDRFCGCCGAILAESTRIAIPRDLATPDGPCADCGDGSYDDGYCSACGSRQARPDRDEASLGRIALITDRGLEHHRNEDAAAAGTLGNAVVVAVCDGVSSSADADRAAAAASTAGVEAMLVALAGLQSLRGAVLAGLAAAAKAAKDAYAGPDLAIAPSCTYTAAAIMPTEEGAVQIAVGNVGDSRAYWLPEPPVEPQQLTVDDSVAQELILAGAAADSAAVQRGAHTLTRWLGADNDAKPWSGSSLHTIVTGGPGSLLLCTDGLWNYLPDAADLAGFVTGADPAAAARALTEYALAAGGLDNITVVVIPIGGNDGFS